MRRMLIALALFSLATSAIAQPTDARPIRLVVPFPAGGATDALARLLLPGLAERLGQPMVVDNRPGAGGIPAAELVVRAAPDGQTLLLATSSIHSTGPALNPNLPYDVVADFTPLSLLAVSPYLLLISATVPADTLEGFIAWAKARPGAVNYGSSGIGTTPHLTCALFDALAGTRMVHVPYRGTGPVYAELRRGDVHALCDVQSTAAPHLAAGAVKALAQTGQAASPLLPGVRAAAEVLPDMRSEVWFGLFGPARMAPAQAQRLQGAAMAALRDPGLRERLAALGAEARGEDGAALARAAATEREQWVRLVRDQGIRTAD